MMKTYQLFLFAVLLIFSASLPAQQRLSVRNPQETGLSPERLDVIDSVLQQYIDREEVPGAVALIARRGKIGYLAGFGMKDMEENRIMTEDAIFRIASMTKAITTVGVMMLFEEGHFKLDDPVKKFIPEFSNMTVTGGEQAKTDITIRHLLTHTSGLSYGFMGPQEMYDLYRQHRIYNGVGKTQGTIGETVKRLASLPLVHQPGEKFQYGMSTDVLGYLIEVISGMTLADFFQQRIFEPLEMIDTHFFLPKAKEDRLAALYGHGSENTLNRIVGEAKSGLLDYADYPTYASNPVYYSGGGGLLSTAPDYSNFLQMLSNNGTFNGKQLLSRKTVELMTSNQTGDLFNVWKGQGFGFGFTISKGPSETGTMESAGTYGWLGVFNTHFWVDPAEQLIGILLTQLQPNQSDIERKFKTLAYQALKD